MTEEYLTARLREIFAVPRTSKKACAAIVEAARGLITLVRSDGGEYRYLIAEPEVFRPLDDKTSRDYSDVCPEEIAVAARCALELNGQRSREALIRDVLLLMNAKKTAKTYELTARGVDHAVAVGLILVTVDGTYTA